MPVCPPHKHGNAAETPLGVPHLQVHRYVGGRIDAQASWLIFCSSSSNVLLIADNDFDYDTINNLGLDEASDSDDSVEEADEEPRGRGATSGGRRPRLAANKSLASQVDGLSGKDRQAVLDAYARQNPFELNPNSEDKDMIKKLAEQVAFLTKTLGAVTQYSGLVNTPERAVASPKAASIASLAKERLAV